MKNRKEFLKNPTGQFLTFIFLYTNHQYKKNFLYVAYFSGLTAERTNISMTKSRLASGIGKRSRADEPRPVHC